MPTIAASKAWQDCCAATARMLEYPDLPRAEVDALEEELFDVIGIDNLIEIKKRTVEKSEQRAGLRTLSSLQIKAFCKITPMKLGLFMMPPTRHTKSPIVTIGTLINSSSRIKSASTKPAGSTSQRNGRHRHLVC